MSFGVEKFKSLLLASSFTVLAGFAVRLIDSVVCGNLLGEEALAGVNLLAPALSFVAFSAALVATGSATCYSLSLGRLEKVRARQFFTQGLWTVVLFGGLFSALFAFGHEFFLSFMGVSGGAADYARRYFAFVWPIPVIEGVMMLLISLCYADGDSRLCMVSYLTVIVLKILISVLGIRLGFGISACALGSVVAETFGVAVLAVHFFRKSNMCRLVSHFSPRDTLRIVVASFGDSAAYLCDALLFFFLTKFAIAFFGAETLPLLGAVNTLWGLLIVFDGLGVAIQPVVTVYYGEGNTRAVRDVMRAAGRIAFIAGLVVTALFLVFPGVIVRLVGLTGTSFAAPAALAVRLIALGIVAHAFVGLFNSYYMFIERPILAFVVTVLPCLVFPVACASLGSLIGVNGFWLGIGLGPLVGLAFAALGLWTVVGRATFPLLLARDGESCTMTRTIPLEDGEIVKTARDIQDFITSKGISHPTAARVSLLTEEIFETVKDRAAGRSLLGEATVCVTGDGITLTLRDDGEIFDITDADARISSLRSFLVASVMERHAGRVNLVTTGFNRNVFKF